MGNKGNAYRILVRKSERKGPLERPRRKRMDNVKMDLREIGWGGMDWIDVVQDTDHWRALLNTVMNLQVSYNIPKFLSSCTIGDFSRTVQRHVVRSRTSEQFFSVYRVFSEF
jgi:hypothetical protein